MDWEWYGPIGWLELWNGIWPNIYEKKGLGMIMAQYGNAHSTNEYKAMTFAGFEHCSTGTIANLLGCCKLWHPVWVSMCLVGQWACWFAMGKRCVSAVQGSCFLTIGASRVIAQWNCKVHSQLERSHVTWDQKKLKDSIGDTKGEKELSFEGSKILRSAQIDICLFKFQPPSQPSLHILRWMLRVQCMSLGAPSVWFVAPHGK